SRGQGRGRWSWRPGHRSEDRTGTWLESEGGHQSSGRRLASEEWRAVQRRCGGHRILRSLRCAERRRVARGHDDGDRSEVSEYGLRDELAFQEGAGWLQMES